MQFGHSNQLNPTEHVALDKWAKAATVSQAELMRLSSRRAKAYMELEVKPSIISLIKLPSKQEFEDFNLAKSKYNLEIENQIGEKRVYL